MGDTVIIRLSSDKVSMDGKPLAESRTEWIEETGVRQLAILGKRNIINDADGQKAAEKMVLSLRENEKAFLEHLIQRALKEVKKTFEFRVFQDISETIDSATESFTIKKAEWEKLKNGFEKLLEDSCKEHGNQQQQEAPKPLMNWLKLKSIIKQLELPEEVADKPAEATAEKKEDKK